VAAVETPDVRAEAKWVRTSARKARLVLEHIRGRTVPEARTVLAFSERAVAREIERVLRSAVANAEANHGLAGDELVVSAAYADEGPTLKRWRPRARGRVSRIHKRTCHITVRLAPPAPSALTRTEAKAEPAVAEEKPKRRATSRKTETAPKSAARKAASASRPKASKRNEKEG
jgi:large subunit ribosomal protein L22